MKMIISLSKGKPMVLDGNNYNYAANASSTEVKYWKCLVKMCSAKIQFFLKPTRGLLTLSYSITLSLEEFLNLIAHKLSLH